MTDPKPLYRKGNDRFDMDDYDMYREEAKADARRITPCDRGTPFTPPKGVVLVPRMSAFRERITDVAEKFDRTQWSRLALLGEYDLPERTVVPLFTSIAEGAAVAVEYVEGGLQSIAVLSLIVRQLRDRLPHTALGTYFQPADIANTAHAIALWHGWIREEGGRVQACLTITDEDMVGVLDRFVALPVHHSDTTLNLAKAAGVPAHPDEDMATPWTVWS